MIVNKGSKERGFASSHVITTKARMGAVTHAGTPPSPPDLSRMVVCGLDGLQAVGDAPGSAFWWVREGKRKGKGPQQAHTSTYLPSASPINIPGKTLDSRDADALDDDGLPPVGTKIKEGDALYSVVDETTGRTKVKRYKGEDAIVLYVSVSGSNEHPNKAMRAIIRLSINVSGGGFTLVCPAKALTRSVMPCVGDDSSVTRSLVTSSPVGTARKVS